MKKIVILWYFMLFTYPSASLLAVEGAPRISDAEIIERLTRLEEGQKAILREMDKRFENIDKRLESIDKRFESIDKRFDQIINLITGIIAAFAGIIAVTIGFALWDRRTMVRPFEARVRDIEDAIADGKNRYNVLIDALRGLSKTDEKVAEVLKKFNLL